MSIVKIIGNNTMYSVQELHFFNAYFHQLFLLLQYFQYNLQQIYQLILFYIYNFLKLNTHQHHMIYHIHTHNYQDSKYILYGMYLYQLILYIHTCIYNYSNVVSYYKPFHLINIYTYMFHATLCVLFRQFLTLD